MPMHDDAAVSAEWDLGSEDFLTDLDIDVAPVNEDDEEFGFYGVGLVISETGKLAIVHANGAMDDWDAYRISGTEAANLAVMLSAVIE